MAGGLSSVRAPIPHTYSSSSPTNSISSQRSDYGSNANSTYHYSPHGKGNFSNSAITEEDEYENPWSFEFSVIMATILSISAFLALVGNAMVLTVIYRHRGMRTRTNLFLVNLAIADFLVGFMVIPFSITTLVEGRWVLSEAICSWNGWMNGMCLITSIHTLMYIGVNKYFSICRPLNNPIQLRHIVTMMVAAWIWGAVCATMTVKGLNRVIYKPGTSQCGPDYPKDLRGYIFHSIVQVTVIILPFCILLFCYIQMFREIRRHSERLRNNTTVDKDSILNQQKRVAVTLFIVLACFIIMALPYHVYASYTTIKEDKNNFSSYINPIAYCFLYLNSMCNPIIYAFRSPAFREGYKEILCQTPSYVIRDDFNILRSSRANSIVPCGRSRIVVSSSSTTTNTDSNESPDLYSPAPLLLSTPVGESKLSDVNTAKPRRLRKQPTVKDMIRSTRRTSAPFVIRRDGDVIVVKSGKIVSVRRESDSSHVFSPTKRLDHAKEVPYGNSIAQIVFSQLTLGTASSATDNLKEKGEAVSDEDQISSNKEQLSSILSDNGDFSQSDLNKKSINGERGDLNHILEEEDEKEVSESNSSNSPLFNGVGKEKYTTDINELPTNDSCYSIEELSMSPRSGHRSNSNRERLKDRRNGPNLIVQIQSPDKRKSPSSSPLLQPVTVQSNIKIDKSNDKNSLLALPALSNMAAGIASVTTDIFLGMPLTPYTRNLLTKSDQHLNTTDPASDAPTSFLFRRHMVPGASSITHAHSSDNLYKKPSRITRYPSIEHLDHHKPLFGSSKTYFSNRTDKTTIV